MIISILATNENVDAVRATATENIPELVGHQLLSIPVSPNGSAPITHWFCQFNTTQEICDRLLALQNLSEMEVNSKDFLKSKNLKVVRS